MLVSRQILAELEHRLAVPSRGFRTVTVTVDLDPLDLVRSGAGTFGQAAFFASPEGRVLGGVGAAWRATAHGGARFADLDRAIGGLDRGIPVLVGFGFEDEPGTGADWEGFAPAAALVPAITVIREGGVSRLVLAVPPGSDGGTLITHLSTLERPQGAAGTIGGEPEVTAVPPPADYVAAADAAVAAIGSGAFDKVVLARTVVVRSAAPIDGFRIAAALRDAHPDSWVFAWQEGDGVFAGASPELLVARRDEHVHLAPLAGSAPRGADPERDRRLGEQLLASGKDRHEHDLVVADAMERLRPLVEGLHRSPTPYLHRTPAVQHLATAIAGTSRARLLALAGALHPTAAVGGLPREAALRFRSGAESFDRGWYTGGIGWADPGGDGELALGLRCALIRGDRAIAFAGGGIVSASDPAAELEETRLKLRPMLELLV